MNKPLTYIKASSLIVFYHHSGAVCRKQTSGPGLKEVQ
jgi:hypothetical protein